MKNFDFLLNHDAGWASDSRSSAEVNLKKTSVKPCVLSRIGSLMARSWQVAASIMLLMILGVGEMWGEYYYRGSDNGSWASGVTMTLSDDGFYYYRAIGKGVNANFKIFSATDDWGAVVADGGKVVSEFNGTDFSSTYVGGSSGNNAWVWNDHAACYILFYPSGTAINNTANHILCASTTLPSGGLYLAGDKADGWLSLRWDATSDTYKMSRVGSTAVYSITVENVSAGDNTHKFKVSNYSWGSSWGHSDYVAASNSNVVSEENADGNIQFKAAMAGDVTVSFNTSTKKVSIICQAPEITLDDNGGSGGSGTQNTYYGETTSSVTVPTKTGYNFLGYWSDDATPVQVINSSGAWIKNVSGYTNNESTAQWVVRADHEFTAHWEAKTYNITYKDQGNVSYSGSNSASLPTSYTYGTGIATLTDGVRSGYRFDGWFDNSSCTGSAVTSISSSATGDKTFYAKWTENPGGTVTLTAGTGGEVSKDNSSWGASKSYTGIKTTDALNIYARANTGYTFTTWTQTSGSGTITSTSSASTTFTPVADADAALTASFTENTVTVSPTCAYDAGNPSYSAPTASNSGTVGISSTSTLVAPAAGTGYTFAGWTLSSNIVVTSGTPATDRTITIRTNGDGNAVTATANYNEVLTTGWKIVGQSTSDKANSPFSSWTYASSTNTMAKASGHSTEDTVYATISVAAASVTGDYYEFKVTAEGTTLYGYGESEGYYILFDETKTDQGVYSNSNNDNALRFKPTIAGDYTFMVDYSSTPKKVSVTFPTAYTLTYSLGTVVGSDGSISTSPTTTSGSKVLSGSTVTLTAPDAKTGYTWKGWYSNNAGTGDQLEDDQEYAITVSANTTVYACYTEDSYTVTVNAGSGGKVSYGSGSAGSSCSASAGVATASSTIHAIPNDGYAFVGWTNVDEEHHITDFDATWNSTNEGWDLTVNADAATTITANFAPRFALKGSLNAADDPLGGMPGWGTAANTTYSEGTYTVSRTLTNPNSSYKFQIVDMRHSTWATRGYSSSENNLAVDNSTTYTLSSDKDVYFDSRGVGTYTFTIVEEEVGDVIYPKVKIQDGANSHLVTWGYKTDNGQEGGTITSVVDGEATPNNIASGEYVKDGGSITATASANSYYHFVDFRTSETYGGGDQLSTSNPCTISSIAADVNIYAQFAENKCAVTITTANSSRGSITVGGEAFTWGSTTQVGTYSYKSLSVTPAAGYYFKEWRLSSTPDFRITGTASDESNTTPDLYGLGGTHGSTGTLTAVFEPLDTIYFQNIVDWEDVYVYFGPSYSGGVQTGSTTRVQMTQVPNSDVYWAYIPRAYTTGSNTNIAFSDYAFPESYTFWQHNGAYRGDWDATLDMYVPVISDLVNETQYYSNGYWMMNNTLSGRGVGYELWRYNKAESSSSKVAEFAATANGAHTSSVVQRIDESSATYKYFVKSKGGECYASTALITSTNYSGIELLHYDSDPKTSVTYDTEGDYTFTLSQGNGSMYLSVDYPVAAGDYRLVYKNNSITNNRYSDVIKAAKGSTAVLTSMYIDQAATGASLKLQICNSIDGETKKPVWGDVVGATGLISSFAGKEKGVYQFTIVASTHTIADIAPYAGNYYIKTDCASGGWGNFKQNVLTKNTVNFSKSDANTFDYYFCQYVANTTTNVKFVVANDYNNAVSDTLGTDAILTRSAIGHETLPEAGNVRFSFNSATNEVKRTYMKGGKGNIHLRPAAEGYVYDAATSGTDLLSTRPALGESGNWVYLLQDVYVYPTAKGGLYTDYPSASPINRIMLVDTVNNVLMGGSIKGETRYKVNLLYDFKTNDLSVAYIPSGAVSSSIDLQSDLMIVRSGAGDANQLSFSGSGALTNVKRAYGVFEFKRDSMVGEMDSWTANDYRARRQCRYYFSLPFNVNVKDIFGVGTYGTHYIIQMYNGVKRAKIGWFMETDSFWETLTTDSVLRANQGYCLMLDREAFNDGSNGVWANIGAGESSYLYFPSASSSIGTISAQSGTYTVAAHQHTSGRTFVKDEKTLNHNTTDSNWGLVGFPSYANTYTDESDFKYYFYNPSDNSWKSATATGSTAFKSMHSYIIQWAGTLNWNNTAYAAAPMRRETATDNTLIRLNLSRNDETQDWAFVRLADDADADFVLNEDMCKIVNSGIPNIYVYAGNYDAAYSRVPVKSQTIEVGVIIRQDGDYTFSMPEGIRGSVVLVDTYEQTRTNLELMDYEVHLERGTINDRFLLEIDPSTVVTAVEDAGSQSASKDAKAKKFFKNDLLYIQHNGVIYDAQGKKVE